MCTKRCRCSVFERLCQHPQQINSRPLCAGGLEKQSDSERAANEFEGADLKVSAARMSDNAAFGHKKPPATTSQGSLCVHWPNLVEGELVIFMQETLRL